MSAHFTPASLPPRSLQDRLETPFYHAEGECCDPFYGNPALEHSFKSVTKSFLDGEFMRSFLLDNDVRQFVHSTVKVYAEDQKNLDKWLDQEIKDMQRQSNSLYTKANSSHTGSAAAASCTSIHPDSTESSILFPKDTDISKRGNAANLSRKSPNYFDLDIESQFISDRQIDENYNIYDLSSSVNNTLEAPAYEQKATTNESVFKESQEEPDGFSTLSACSLSSSPTSSSRPLPTHSKNESALPLKAIAKNTASDVSNSSVSFFPPTSTSEDFLSGTEGNLSASFISKTGLSPQELSNKAVIWKNSIGEIQSLSSNIEALRDDIEAISHLEKSKTSSLAEKKEIVHDIAWKRNLFTNEKVDSGLVRAPEMLIDTGKSIVPDTSAVRRDNVIAQKESDTDGSSKGLLHSFIKTELTKRKFYSPPSKMGEEAERQLLEVFCKYGSDGLTEKQFEEAVVVPILKLGAFVSETLFRKIDSFGLGKINFSALKRFWEGRLVLGSADPTMHDATIEESLLYAPSEELFQPSGTPSTENRPTFSIKRYSVMNFFYILKKEENNFLERDDFDLFLNELLKRNAYMSFLSEDTFSSASYKDSVIGRIMFDLDKDLSGKIYLKELRRSKLVHIWCSVDENSQICYLNQYFSYEQFYVLFTYFDYLDEDGDRQLDKADLLKIDNHSLSTLANDRIWSQMAPKFYSTNSGYMNFDDWIWFLMVYEDMTTDRSIEFWFKILDLDGDGCLREHELQSFFNEQAARLAALGHEEVKFEDWLCQMIDAVNPREEGVFYLHDLKESPKYSSYFLGSLVSLSKWISWEQRDVHKEVEMEHFYPGFTPWDHFCREKYISFILAANGSIGDIYYDAEHTFS